MIIKVLATCEMTTFGQPENAENQRFANGATLRISESEAFRASKMMMTQEKFKNQNLK